MEMTAAKYGDVLLFSAAGRLDVESYQSAEQNFKSWVEAGEKWLVGDFSAMEFISSIGLRVLLSVVKQLAARQGKMVLYGLNPTIKEVFTTTGLANLIPITDSQDSAIKVLTG